MKIKPEQFLLASIELMLIIIPMACENESKKILDKDIVDSEDSVTLTCDVTKFTYNHTANELKSLTISKRHSGQVDWKTVIQYNPFDPDVQNREVIKNDQARQDWNVTFTGGNVINNKRVMKVTLLITQASCQDEGWYRCVMVRPLRRKSGNSFSLDEPLTEQQQQSVKTFRPEATYYFPRCDNTTDTALCHGYFHMTTLIFTMSAEDEGGTFVCALNDGPAERCKMGLKVSLLKKVMKLGSQNSAIQFNVDSSYTRAAGLLVISLDGRLAGAGSIASDYQKHLAKKLWLRGLQWKKGCGPIPHNS